MKTDEEIFDLWKTLFILNTKAYLKEKTSPVLEIESRKHVTKQDLENEIAVLDAFCLKLFDILQSVNHDKLITTESKFNSLFSMHYKGILNLVSDLKKQTEKYSTKSGPKIWPLTMNHDLLVGLTMCKNNKMIRDLMYDFLKPNGEFDLYLKNNEFLDPRENYIITFDPIKPTQWIHNLKRTLIKNYIFQKHNLKPSDGEKYKKIKRKIIDEIDKIAENFSK